MKFTFNAARLTMWLGVAALAACGQSGNSVVADWHSNGSEAKQLALQLHHPLFIAFVGSDWSEPSQSIRKDILDTQAFKDFAEANLVLVTADFPRGTLLTPEQAKLNADLAKSGEVDRLPVFLMVDPRNEVAFGRIANFVGSPEMFIAQIQSALDQYSQNLQANAQVASSTPAPQPAAAPALPPSGPTFSQPAAPSSKALPALPAFPSSLPTPDELFRRQPQNQPSPQ